MDIEVLHQGTVITRVVGTVDPDAEVTRYGGDSWQPYIESVEITLQRNRAIKTEQVKQVAQESIKSLVAALDSWPMLQLMREMIVAGMVSLPTPGSNMDKVKNIVQVVKSRLDTIEIADQATLDSYDPYTDPGLQP